MNPFIANVSAYRIVISYNYFFGRFHVETSSHNIYVISQKQNPTKKRFLIRDNNTTTNMYKPIYTLEQRAKPETNLNKADFLIKRSLGCLDIILKTHFLTLEHFDK